MVGLRLRGNRATVCDEFKPSVQNKASSEWTETRGCGQRPKKGMIISHGWSEEVSKRERKDA
jgi:hypothetical protein